MYLLRIIKGSTLISLVLQDVRKQGGGGVKVSSVAKYEHSLYTHYRWFYSASSPFSQHVGVLSALSMAADLSASGRLAVRVMAVLFCWHCQQRSDRGFITMTDGVSFLQR